MSQLNNDQPRQTFIINICTQFRLHGGKQHVVRDILCSKVKSRATEEIA